MKFPVPRTNYDESGCAANLAAEIHKSGLALFEIVNADKPSSKAMLDGAKEIAASLAQARDRAVLNIGISNYSSSGSPASVSVVAAILDASAYSQDILHSLNELSEHDSPEDIGCILSDLAIELHSHDHAESTADWVSSPA
ncbi:hypothetical protein AWB77_04814 [Caballeronia fortuita]|uniref:Uncharacterized protein n=1 Tax=Caballeronia fortuita TaxID=1777138 RepID=A0A158D2J7_9BURK|nr:hypothetical protein [Caballeronia fortuita]SAK88723.1 hypothetical protein AWB77_04814 [Caballeronia fortuita]